jgi:MFS transporter, ACS family, hexuronate transporter
VILRKGVLIMGKPKFWTYENKLTVIFFFLIGFVFFDRLAINYLFPMISVDLGLNYTQLGLLGAALALTWSVAGPLGGFISDKVNNKRAMLAILVLAFSVISLLHGLAQSFAMLFVLRLLMGIVEGPLIPQTQSILAMESSERRRGFNLGFTMNTSNALFGSILAPVAIVALATNFDWHMAFYLTIIPGIILSLVILKAVKNPDSAKYHTMHATKSTEKIKVKDILKLRNIWLSIIVFSLVMTVLMAFQIFGPTYLVIRYDNEFRNGCIRCWLCTFRFLNPNAFRAYWSQAGFFSIWFVVNSRTIDCSIRGFSSINDGSFIHRCCRFRCNWYVDVSYSC